MQRKGIVTTTIAHNIIARVREIVRNIGTRVHATITTIITAERISVSKIPFRQPITFLSFTSIVT